MMLLKNNGAVKWNDKTKKLLEQDLADFKKNPRHNIKSITASRKYYENTMTYKCLCNGDKPKNPEDAY